MNEPQPTERSSKGPPKLYHKKSRTGCQRCRARRVKCDEVHPVCQNCQRHQLPCIYDRTKPGNAERPGSGSNTLNHRGTGTSPGNDTTPASSTEGDIGNDSSESRARRLLELRLLHHFVTKTSLTLLSCPEDPKAVQGWSTDIPNLALSNDALLYSIFTLSALHLSKLTPQDENISIVHQNYLDLTLREHRNDIQHLCRSNADVVCLTSTNIRFAAFSMLQERTIFPYEPPLHWLQMTSGGLNVFAATWQWLANDSSSLTIQLINRSRMLSDIPTHQFNKDLFQASDPDMSRILRRSDSASSSSSSLSEAASEPWSPEIEEAYDSTIKYISGIRQMIVDGDGRSDTCRKLLVFPIMAQPQFITLVTERRPRALVVLAYYFALLALFKSYWFIGETGQREVNGIFSLLSREWHDLLAWPLQVARQESLV